MPMTYTQASTQNVVNSVKDYLVANVKNIYDPKAAASQSWIQPINFTIMTPDDPSIYASVPCIAIDLPTDIKSPEPLGFADRTVWKFKQIHLVCYPGIDTNGKPSIQSAAWLETCLDYALGTALVMPINDYSTDPITNGVDFAYVEDQRLIHPKGHPSDVLAIERHRFDYSFTLKYSVVTIGA